MLRGDHLALLEHEAVMTNGVRDNGAKRLSDRNRTEFQAAIPSARKGFLRKAPISRR